MDNNVIYDIMIRECLKRLTKLRDQIDINFSSEEFEPDLLYQITNQDGLHFNEIIKRSDEIIEWGICNTIAELLKIYKHNTEWIKMMTFQSISLENNDKKTIVPIEYEKRDSYSLSFIIEKDEKKTLYLIKKFGFSKRFTRESLDELTKKYSFQNYKYLTLVEDGAFLEVLNHNSNENDPCRGTLNISLKEFFIEFFSVEEYDNFKQNLDKLVKCANEYYGLSVFKSLVPNALYRFRNLTLKNFKNLTQTNIIIPKNQRSLIEIQLYDNHKFDLLFGNSTFAQCYLSAEWLYDSLKQSRNIDLTAISMGYFKLIEQLLFAYISLHTIENDPSVSRFIYENRSKKLIPLTNQNINDKNNFISLGSLTGFFGYHDQNTNCYKYNNPDLFITGVSEQIKEMIIDDFQAAKELRNEYFHRENITSWSDIEQHRIIAHKVLFWILGACNYSQNELIALGFAKHSKTDFQELCQCIHYISYRSIKRSLKGFDYAWSKDDNDDNDKSKHYYTFSYMVRIYSNENTVILEGIPHPDEYIDYSDIKNPVFSGLYIKPLETDKPVRITENNIPYRITIAKLNISSSIPLDYQITEEREIFANGIFIKQEDIMFQ